MSLFRARKPFEYSTNTMYLKLFTMTLVFAAMGLCLLHLRQSRVRLAHEMVLTHIRIDESRHALWRYQTALAQRLTPATLRASVEHAGLTLESVTPGTGDVMQHRNDGGSGGVAQSSATTKTTVLAHLD
jgi:hypothetical protein